MKTTSSARSLMPWMLAAALAACGPQEEVLPEVQAPAVETSALAAPTVNGYTVSSTEDSWLNWIAVVTVPVLKGTRDQRLDQASRVAWWSLKEGVLALSAPLPYSNCNNTHIGPVDPCGYNTWQVGLAGMQVRNTNLTEAAATAKSLYPNLTEAQFLGATAEQDGFPAGSSTYNAIVNSTGTLRQSWFIRHHGVAFILQDPIVTRECITNKGCNSTAWATSKKYAPDFAGSTRARADVRAILAARAP